MIRENYGNISGSSESGSTGGSSSSGLNEQQVISLINSQTVQNLTNNFHSSDFNSFTNLNNWVNNKVNTIIENPVEEVYNRIKSDLYDKQITHTPINNICFTINGSGSLSNRHTSFNTNSLSFTSMVTKAYNETISVNKGDVLIVFYKTQYSSGYVINNMMIILGGLNMSGGVKLTVPFNTSGNVTYFRATPFASYYSNPLNFISMTYNTSIELRTNAKCMSSSSNYTDIINLNYDPTKINYYFLWSGSNDPNDTEYIDFTNIFMTDVTTYNIFLNRACDSSLVDLSQLSAESNARLPFYAIGQRNSIQNEVVNMFNDKEVLNDFRKIMNLFQTYSIQSIYTSDNNICCPLHFDLTDTAETYDNNPVGKPEVFVAFIKDQTRNIIGIDLVYVPTAKTIRNPTTGSLGKTIACFNPCNNIFNTCNDLTLTFSGGINLNRNLSFTINFMDIRDSEYSTHLILYSKRLSFANLLNQLNRDVTVPSYLVFNLNSLNNSCYYLNLDDYIDQKQGTIMDTYESDNIRISFDKLI